jgi:4-hydroxy-tetrahydrodipicolinate reductase
VTLPVAARLSALTQDELRHCWDTNVGDFRATVGDAVAMSISQYVTKADTHPLAAIDAEQKVIKVGLIGFGRTGREVSTVLMAESGMSLEWVVKRTDRTDDRSAAEVLGVRASGPAMIHSIGETAAERLLDLAPVDVIIDFSSESGLDYYGRAAAATNTAVVSAVSKYSEGKQRQLADYARSTRVLWSPNITLGINFMLLAAQTLQRIAPAADVQIVEEHFRDKPEVSGTALRLARGLDLPEDAVHSIRAGGIIGVHEIMFGFPSQTLRLRHEAVSRQAFGHGAAFAAKELVTCEPGMYRMEDILRPHFSHQTAIMPATTSTPSGIRSGVASRLRAIAQRLESS